MAHHETLHIGSEMPQLNMREIVAFVHGDVQVCHSTVAANCCIVLFYAPPSSSMQTNDIRNQLAVRTQRNNESPREGL